MKKLDDDFLFRLVALKNEDLSHSEIAEALEEEGWVSPRSGQRLNFMSIATYLQKAQDEGIPERMSKPSLKLV